MSCKEEFIEIFKENITRPGADALLDYLTNKSDFFTAPASARYHGAYEGGLCEHSLNVYHCLADYLSRERVNELYGLDDPLPYGHGEKSVYIVNGYLRLTREEAFAIRYHMGFSGNEDKGSVGKAFQMFPLAFALSVADMEATYFLEGEN